MSNLSLCDIKVLNPKRHGDRRGLFSEVYNKRAFAQAGYQVEFVQDNHSFSTDKGTVRGLHFQPPPVAQHKLVRVVRGSVFDVAIDLRRRSTTYGLHASVVLSADAWNQIFIPVGFAHGLMTLESNTEVVYKVSDYYSPEHERGLLWSDPELGIQWPLPVEDAVLSDKDQRHPRLEELKSPFP